MLKIWLFLILGLTVIFYSCDKREDCSCDKCFNITATNVSNNASGVTTVKAFIGGSEVQIAQAEYKNNGFTLKLPKTLEPQYVISLDYWWQEMYVSDRKNVFTKYLRQRC